MSTAHTAAAKLRFQEIDAFRGLASLWVVFYHYVLWYPVTYQRSAAAVAGWATPWLPDMPNKYFGLLPVWWFFVISGFVISWSLEGCRTAQDFAVSRFSRLYPTYWVAMALVIAQGLAFPLPGQAITPGQVLANLTMLQQVPGIPDIDGVYWSLLVELLFYLLMGTVFALGRMHRLHALCLVWVSACILNHALAVFGIDVFWKVQKYGLLLQGHFLIAGVMFYQAWRGRQVALSYFILQLCLVSIFLACPKLVGFGCAGFFTLFHLAIQGRLRRLAVPPLLWLGGISYALYVSHQMLGYRVMMALEDDGVPRWAAVGAAAALALGLATLLHHAVELPAMAAIRAAWKRRARVTAPA